MCTALRCVRTPGAGHASTGRMDDVTENDCVDRTAVHVAMSAEDIHLLDHSVKYSRGVGTWYSYRDDET